MAKPDSVLAPLDGKSPALFLVAGGLLVGYAGLTGLEALTGSTFPMLRDSGFRLVGYIVGLVALLGLYPSLADRSPKISRAGAALAVLGIVGWLVDGLAGTTRSLAVYLGFEPPAWTAVFGVLIILAYLVGYLCVGVASLRTGAYSRTVGLALLAPVAGMILNLSMVAATGASAGPEHRFVVASGFAIAHLAVGVALRTDARGTRQPEATADATAR